MKAKIEKRICSSSMLKESCNRGRKGREEDEMVFSEGERDYERLKRGGKDKTVNRSRKQQEKALCRLPYSHIHLADLAKPSVEM